VLRRLIEISRPVLWINTIGTVVIGMWLTGDLWRWEIIPILVWVTFPFNLLIYGVNDIFDQDTDQDNDRKGGYGGAKIRSHEVRPIAWAVVLTNIPFLVYFAVTLPWPATLWMVAYAFSFWQYSSPPLRFKGRPIWDSLSNADYAFPLVFVAYALGSEPIWAAAIGLMAWSMAKHVYDAIQDIDEDGEAQIRTTAVAFGLKGALVWSAAWWTVSTVLFALVNIPVAVVNALIAGWLVIALWRRPTIATARNLYRFSVTFPYVAGAVAGFQLVVGIVFGSYQP
jgi:4-hydroxybenzoate polyprenyltransferase